MAVTVVNGTNAPINVSLSVGFPYVWKNKLNPLEFVELDPGVPIVSLNARYWLGEATEFSRNWSDIGWFAGSLFVGALGVGLCFTGAGIALIVSAAVGIIGTTAGAIQIGVAELAISPAHLPEISVKSNLKFLITGKLDMSEDRGVATIGGGDAIAIAPFSSNEHFASWIAAHKPVSVTPDPESSKPIEKYYADRSDLEKDGVFDAPVWIYPSLSGVPHVNPPCWEFQKDAVQLSSMNNEKMKENIVWKIEYARQYDRIDVVGGVDSPKADAFRLRNLKLDQYASVASTRVEGIKTIVASPRHDDATLFFIIKSGNCYVFVPCCRQLTYLVDEDGKLSQGTKVLLDASDVHPARVRWAVDRIPLPNRKLKVEDLADIVSHRLSAIDSPPPNFSQKRLRFLPALLGERKLDAKLSCWEFDKSTGLIQLGEREVEWMIVDAKGRNKDTFYLYCPEVRKFAGFQVGHENPKGLRETDLILDPISGFIEFFITESLGCLCFHAKVEPDQPSQQFESMDLPTAPDPRYCVFAEDTKNGKKLRIAAWNKNYPRSLARWLAITTRVI